MKSKRDKIRIISNTCRNLVFSELVIERIKKKYKIERYQVLLFFQIYYLYLRSSSSVLYLSPSVLRTIRYSRNYIYHLNLLIRSGLLVRINNKGYYEISGLGFNFYEEYDKLYNEMILDYERKYKEYLPFWLFFLFLYWFWLSYLVPAARSPTR